jgi:hypothetical protein
MKEEEDPEVLAELSKRTTSSSNSSLPATALAGLDFHQLDPFERFHPLTGIPLPQASLGAIFLLSARLCGWDLRGLQYKLSGVAIVDARDNRF